MRKIVLLLVVLFALVASPASAQSGSLSAPVATPNLTKVIVGDVTEHRSDPITPNDINYVTVVVREYTSTDTHPLNADITITITTGATINAFEDARSTTAGGENASGSARQNFRVLTWLKANTATSGVAVKCADGTNCAATLAAITVGTV